MLAPSTSKLEITPALLAELRDNLSYRRISRGFAVLEEYVPLIHDFDPSHPRAAVFLAYLARWVDVGYADVNLVKILLAKFPLDSRSRLTLHEYANLRLCQALIAMTEEESDVALAHLDFILSIEPELQDPEITTVTHFWKARCHRKRGDYDSAFAHAEEGRNWSLRLGAPEMAAVMRVLESWLVFQKGRSKEAIKILEEAEAVVRRTDDWVTLGNIQSSYGRILRRSGRYDLAIDHFSNAIVEYRKRDPRHPHLARTLANLAYVKRLMALQLRKKIDADIAQRRKAQSTPLDPGKRLSLQQLEHLRAEALEELDEAMSIYRENRSVRGEGTVHSNRSYLFLDSGDLDDAMAEATVAFQLGEEKKDYILMARARLLQCMAENVKIEEEVVENADPGMHAQAALEFVRDAVGYASRTENRRLLARCHIWLGLTLTNGFFNSADEARESCELAASHLRPENRDHVWEDLQTLRARLLRIGGVDATLRAWSQGVVGDKSFQEISEEFAALIIPKVWEREGRKISRVATRLSISPKKVRRILNRLGLNSSETEAAG